MIKPDGEDMAKLTAMGDDVVKQGAKEGRKIAGDTPNTIDSEKIIKEKSGKETGSGVQITDSVKEIKVENIGETIDANLKGKEKYTEKIKWGIHEIQVRPEGKGFWGERKKQKNHRVDNYELKINPNNESYYLPHPDGGYVQFENMINFIVQDGKLVMSSKSFYYIKDLPSFAKESVLKEAKRQIEAATAAGYQVEWLVSDQKAIEQLKELFDKENINIKITYYPE